MKDLLIWLGVLTASIAAVYLLAAFFEFIVAMGFVAFTWFVIFKFVAYACDFEKRNFRNRND